MDTLREVVIDEARWPRMFAKLRRAGMYSSCGCTGCGQCQASAQQFVRGIARSGRATRVAGEPSQLMLRRRLGRRAFGLLVDVGAEPAIVDVDVQALPIEDRDADTQGATQDELRGPIVATIRWTPKLTLDQVRRSHPWRGGVYVLLNKDGGLLKAGETGSYGPRAHTYQGASYQNREPVFRPFWMYLGTITLGPGTRNPKATVLNVERAITRTLLRLTPKPLPLVRAGALPLPLEESRANRPPNVVVGNLRIEGLLPPALVPDVRAAYTGGVPSAPADAAAQRLTLTPAQSRWEV